MVVLRNLVLLFFTLMLVPFSAVGDVADAPPISQAALAVADNATARSESVAYDAGGMACHVYELTTGVEHKPIEGLENDFLHHREVTVTITFDKAVTASGTGPLAVVHHAALLPANEEFSTSCSDSAWTQAYKKFDGMIPELHADNTTVSEGTRSVTLTSSSNGCGVAMDDATGSRVYVSFTAHRALNYSVEVAMTPLDDMVQRQCLVWLQLRSMGTLPLVVPLVLMVLLTLPCCAIPFLIAFVCCLFVIRAKYKQRSQAFARRRSTRMAPVKGKGKKARYGQLDDDDDDMEMGPYTPGRNSADRDL